MTKKKAKAKTKPGVNPGAKKSTKQAPKGKLLDTMGDLTEVLNKKHAKLVQLEDLTFVSTGLPYIDRIISGKVRGGGLPAGGVIEISGPFGSGKTTLALTILRRFLRHYSENDGVLFFDYEQSVSLSYARRAFGLDLKHDPRIWYATPMSIEDARRVLATLFVRAIERGSCPVKLIVFDSVAAMNPEAYLAGALGGDRTKQLGVAANEMARLFTEAIGFLRHWGITVILTNQLRSKIKIGLYDTGPTEETTGGNALKFYCWTRVTLKPLKTISVKHWDPETGEEKDRKLFTEIRISTMKNKVADPHVKDTVHIRYGYGFDNAYTTVVKGLLFGMNHPDSKKTKADLARNRQPFVTKVGAGAATRYVVWRYEGGGINPITGQEDPIFCKVKEQKNSTGRRIVIREELLSAKNPVILSELLIRKENAAAWKYLIGEVLRHYIINDIKIQMTPAEKAEQALEFDGSDDVDGIADEEAYGIDTLETLDLDSMLSEDPEASTAPTLTELAADAKKTKAEEKTDE